MAYSTIDTHSHVNFVAFDEDRDEVVLRAAEAGVAMINVGTQVDTTRVAVEMAEKYDNCYAIIGLHPIHTSRSYHDTEELGEGAEEFTSRGEVFDIDFYRPFLQREKVVGVGETGFDYYRTTESSLEAQRSAFEGQIQLAIEGDLPLMIHTRGKERSDMSAYHDALDVIESYQREHGDVVRGNLHFFAGDEEVARRALAANFSLSFTGVVTFTRDYDDMVRYAPEDMIHGETDCPYVAPTPHRGKRNEPLWVQEVYTAIADIRGVDRDVMAAQLVKNAEKLYKIKLTG